MGKVSKKTETKKVTLNGVTLTVEVTKYTKSSGESWETFSILHNNVCHVCDCLLGEE